MAGQDPIKVLCADDHPLLREGIAALVNRQRDMKLVAVAGSGREAILSFREHRPDVTLMDLRLPDMSGIDTMIAIRSEFPDARILMLTTFEGDVEIRRALEVLQHIAGGNRNQDIAQQLFISEETVKVHVKHIMEKLGASDRTQAVAIGIRRGIIQL